MIYRNVTLCLVFLWLFFPQTPARADINSLQFGAPVFCKEGCHEIIYKEWETSMHSLSYQDIFFQKMFLAAAREAGEETARRCIKCHAPLAYLSKENPPVDGSNMTPISKRGIQCDFCHTITGFEGRDPGDGNYIVQPGNTKLGPYKDSFCKKHKSAYSALHTKSAFCGICHQLSHPEKDIALISTYEEWAESDYNVDEEDEDGEDGEKGGNIRKKVECQHCHMSPGITKFVPRPGRNDLQGPERKHVAMHNFIGLNSLYSGQDLLFTPKDFEKRRQEIITKRLRAAASLEIESSRKEGSILNIVATVNAVGAGHKLPTGTPEREAWLEVAVFDAAGNTIYQTEPPGLYRDGRKERGVFRLVLGDKTGTETFKMWEADQILSDTRLKPKEIRKIPYTITIPPDTGSPLTVRVKLLYRAVPPHVTDFAFGEGKMRAPIMEMSAVTTQVE